MKKFALVLCLTFIAILFNGCGYKEYSGDSSELYTEAINSVMWNNGHSYKADKEADSQIEIIEKDDYGRTLFTYYEKYYAGAKLTFSALLISQCSADGFVYYYEDYNFLIKRQELYSSNIKKFTQEEINNLKEINDWDKKLNLEKCIKKRITKEKQEIPNDDNAIYEKVVDKFNLVEGTYNLFMDFSTDDDCEHFIFYGSIIKFNEEDIFFIALSKKYSDEIYFLVPADLYDYRQELIELKKQNGWSSQTQYEI